MKLLQTPRIHGIWALAGVIILASCCVPGVASAHQRAPRPELALRAETGGELVKVGSPAVDIFAGVENSEGGCQERALGHLRSNLRPTDRVEFSGSEELKCFGGWRLVSGELEEIELTSSGTDIMETSWSFEVPGDCVYSVKTLEGTFAIPSELLLQRGLYGVAKLRPKKSAKGCPSTKAVKSEMDLSDVEIVPLTLAYATELIEAT